MRRLKLVGAIVRAMSLAMLLLTGSALLNVTIGAALGALVDLALDIARVARPDLAIVGIVVGFVITLWKELK